MALADDFAASLDPRVIAQVTDAIYKYASIVAAEGTAVTGHAIRAPFATKLMTGQISFQPLILSAVAFASLNAASTDTAVNNAVAASFNLWAGNI